MLSMAPSAFHLLVSYGSMSAAALGGCVLPKAVMSKIGSLPTAVQSILTGSVSLIVIHNSTTGSSTVGTTLT